MRKLYLCDTVDTVDTVDSIKGIHYCHYQYFLSLHGNFMKQLSNTDNTTVPVTNWPCLFDKLLGSNFTVTTFTALLPRGVSIPSTLVEIILSYDMLENGRSEEEMDEIVFNRLATWPEFRI